MKQLMIAILLAAISLPAWATDLGPDTPPRDSSQTIGTAETRTKAQRQPSEKIELHGYLGWQAPVGFEPDRAVDRPSQFIGGLSLQFPRCPLRFNVDAQHSLRGDTSLDSESKVKGTVTLPLKYGWSAFTSWQRRYRSGEDRLAAGVRWDF